MIQFVLCMPYQITVGFSHLIGQTVTADLNTSFHFYLKHAKSNSNVSFVKCFILYIISLTIRR